MPSLLDEDELLEPDSEGMLDRFVSIADAEGVLRFARSFGPLLLCSHNMPASHVEQDDDFQDLWGTHEPCGGRVLDAEPLEAWYEWVACARAILNCAAALHEERFPDVEQWAAVFSKMSVHDSAERLAGHRNEPDALGTEQVALGDIIWEWLLMGDVEPKFLWDGEPRFFLQAGTFGLLGIQIMQAVSHAPGLAICSGCGNPYMRRGRRPQAGRRNYCPDCGQRAAIRDAARARRAKKRGQHDSQG